MPEHEALSMVGHLSDAALSTDGGVRLRRLVVWKECHSTRRRQLARNVVCACVRNRSSIREFAVEPDVGMMVGAFGPTHLREPGFRAVAS